MLTGYSGGDMGVPLIDTATVNLSPFSNRNSRSEGHAVSARMAGRANAAKVPQSEIDKLMEERATLLDKKLSGEISKRELNRLEYVRWSLDRIDDAKYGFALDALQEAVQMYEHFGEKITSLTDELKRFTERNHG